MALSMGFRRTMLFGAILVFAVATYGLILYAQGFSFSFEDREFVLTGALTINANEQVDVFIDGEQSGSTSVLTHEFNKGRMLPGTYIISLQRDGFSEWSKSVIIQERFVTDFSHVLILDLSDERASKSRGDIEHSLRLSEPQLTPTPTVESGAVSEEDEAETEFLTYELQRGILTLDDRELGRGVLGYQESNDGSKLLWWTRNEIIVMWLQDTSYQPFRLAGETETITRISTSIARAAWWPDSHHIAFRTGTLYRIVELDNRGGTNTIRL